MPALTDLPTDAQEAAAKQIADLLRDLLGNADPLDPDVWQLIATERGCPAKAFYDAGGERGFYFPAAPDGVGQVRFNVAYPLETQCRVLVHEIAHHELHIWIPPRLQNAADLQCYDGDVSDVRHAIARRVEGLIFKKGE